MIYNKTLGVTYMRYTDRAGPYINCYVNEDRLRMKYILAILLVLMASAPIHASNHSWGTEGTSTTERTLASIMSKNSRTFISIKFEKGIPVKILILVE